jgi:hypothetical protein
MIVLEKKLNKKLNRNHGNGGLQEYKIGQTTNLLRYFPPRYYLHYHPFSASRILLLAPQHLFQANNVLFPLRHQRLVSNTHQTFPSIFHTNFKCERLNSSSAHSNPAKSMQSVSSIKSALHTSKQSEETLTYNALPASQSPADGPRKTSEKRPRTGSPEFEYWRRLYRQRILMVFPYKYRILLFESGITILY